MYLGEMQAHASKWSGRIVLPTVYRWNTPSTGWTDSRILDHEVVMDLTRQLEFWADSCMTGHLEGQTWRRQAMLNRLPLCIDRGLTGERLA